MSNKDTQNVLRVEQLYYLLQLDPLEDGKRLWFDLTALDDDYVNSLLPGEIKKYKTQFDPETQFEIHSKIAQMELEANHLTQAKGEWMQIYELGKSENRNDWMASALIGQANCEKDLRQALELFQKAGKFCEEKLLGSLPAVYNMIGFTYRRMQKIDEAIEWYQKAQKAFQENPWDMALGARIANDLGYAYSLVGSWAECRENVKEGQEIRQSLLLQLEQEVLRIEEELKSTTNSDESGKLRDDLNRKKTKLTRASLELGLSYSTLGEIYRYDNDLDASLRNYREALELFEKVRNYNWQAKALFSRGETRRRIAETKFKGIDEVSYKENMEEAQVDIQESLYLCEKYQLKTERDTANRRMGRVLHDMALYDLESDNKSSAQEYLEQARLYFVEGLKYARETDDSLEELSNLAELAFIVDDFMNVFGPEKVPPKYQASLDEFKAALDVHQVDEFRIHQFSVFENLYKIEKAATDYQSGDYEQALKGYLEGYVGLASETGYGRTRYKQHFTHLTGQIENLPAKVMKIWCETFIDIWENTLVKGKYERTLAQEVRRPDLVVWCRQQLKKIETQKG